MMGKQLVKYIGLSGAAALSKLPDNYGAIVISIPPEGLPGTENQPKRFMYSTLTRAESRAVLIGMIESLEDPDAYIWYERGN